MGFSPGQKHKKCNVCVSGDSLTYHVGQRFSTMDQDNDPYSSQNCASNAQGGWWYNRCYTSNLNGPYMMGATTNDRSLSWYSFKRTTKYSLKFAEMKTRP